MESQTTTQNEVIEGFRLSPQQTHLWSIEPGCTNPVYGARCLVRIDGQLDASLLRTVLESIVSRHEILRTNYKLLEGMTIPVQVVAADFSLALSEYDLRDNEGAEQERIVAALYDEERRRTFAVDHDLPFRVSLVTLASNRHALLISLPALAADATTLRSLVQEIAAAYSACLAGVAPFSDEPVQYADLAEWHTELLESPDTEAGRTFWREREITHVSGELPFEKKFTGEKEFSTDVVRRNLAPSITSEIKALGSSSFLLACWQILMLRLSGETSVVTSVAFDGRGYEEIKNTCGPLTRYLPQETTFARGVSLREISQANATQAAEFAKWQLYFSPEAVSLGFEYCELPE